MYASHRDACILSKYAHDLNKLLNQFYEEEKLSDNIIAYRKLGKANYDFAAEAHEYARSRSSCVVMCFDITGFFDHLSHKILRANLKRILSTDELSSDWYAVLRHVTKYRRIAKSDLSTHPIFGARIVRGSRLPIATISEIKCAGVSITENTNDFGIPQGTPISATFSNLYMLDFDLTIATRCRERGALYRRYSDDVLLVCSAGDQVALYNAVHNSCASLELSLSAEKEEIVSFGNGHSNKFQYLGFNMSPDGALIRASSLSRQWRKLRKSIRRAKVVGGRAIRDGNANKIFTKKLRRKFSPVGVRNFSSYARRASDKLESKQMMISVRRLERAADKAIRELNS